MNGPSSVSVKLSISASIARGQFVTVRGHEYFAKRSERVRKEREINCVAFCFQLDPLFFLGLRIGRADSFAVMPAARGPSKRNPMPSDSSARRISSRVRSRGTRPSISNKAIVRVATFEVSASSSCEMLSHARAARHCDGVRIIIR